MHRILFFFLLLLVACSSGGDSTSAVPPIEPIENIQGLWVEADQCNCRVVEPGSPLTGLPVRCYHYFVGTRAVSGYIRLGEEGQTNRTVAAAAQMCGTDDYRLAAAGDALVDILSAFRTGPAVASFRNQDLPEGVGSLTYAVATVNDVSLANVTISQADPTNRSGRSFADGVAIDYTYDASIADLVGRLYGICTAYRKFSRTELYLGLENPPGPQGPDCDEKRFLTLERYTKSP